MAYQVPGMVVIACEGLVHPGGTLRSGLLCSVYVPMKGAPVKAKLWRVVVFALRVTSDRFYAYFVHYLPLWRGRWSGRLHLRDPKRLTEKLLWLKIHIDRINPQAHLYADKLVVRDYVAETVGEEHLIPLLGTWDRADDIVWSDLPRRFALNDQPRCRIQHPGQGSVCS